MKKLTEILVKDDFMLSCITERLFIWKQGFSHRSGNICLVDTVLSLCVAVVQVNGYQRKYGSIVLKLMPLVVKIWLETKESCKLKKSFSTRVL